MKVDMDGNFEVTASPAETFAFITEPRTFAPILPYFKELHSVEGDGFGVLLEVGVPQIRGRADVAARRIESVPNERVVYTINGRHALGMIDARMTFAIEPIEAGSRVNWTSEGTVSGTLASLAQGILLPLARRQVKSLVVAVQKELGVVQLEPAASPSLMKRSVSSMKGLFGAARAKSPNEDLSS
nr:SRPBCC domain-containing protein [Mesorhizobium loti]